MTASDYVLRRCEPADLATLLDVQERVLSALPHPELLEGSTDADFRRYLGGAGEMLGAYRGDELVGYVIHMTLSDADPRLRDLGAEIADELRLSVAQVGVLDTVAVDPAHRGHGLQLRMCELVHSRAQANGMRALLTTVSPRNAVSLENFRRLGYAEHSIRTLFGKDRSVLTLSLT